MGTGGHRVITVIARSDPSLTYVILKSHHHVSEACYAGWRKDVRKSCMFFTPLCKVCITIPITDKELEAPRTILQGHTNSKGQDSNLVWSDFEADELFLQCCCL